MGSPANLGVFQKFIARGLGGPPACLRNFWEPDEREIFAIIARRCERDNAEFRERVFLYIESDAANGDPRQAYAGKLEKPGSLLPNTSDGDLSGYLQRLNAVIGPNRRFGIQIGGLAEEPEIREILLPFADKVREVSGENVAVIAVGGFAGNYRRTPFGIHKDDSNILTLVIRGKKVFSLWSDKQLGKRPEIRTLHDSHVYVQDADDDAALLASRTIIEGHPGDIIFFGPRAWHRADPSDDLVMTLTCSVEFNSGNVGSHSVSYNPSDRILRGKVRGYLREGHKLLSKGAEASRASMALKWFAWSSSEGYMNPIRERSAPKPRQEDRFRLRISRSLQVHHFEGKVYIAANGRALTLTGDAKQFRAIRKVVEKMKKQPEWSVTDVTMLLSRAIGEDFDAETSLLLSRLHAWWVIDILS